MSHDESHRDDHGRHRHGDHDHAHGGGDGHAPARFGRAFAIGAALNLGFVIVEAIYGVLSNSVALLADAGHNASDVLALAVAWLASELIKRPPTARFTYGLRGSSILAALFNAMFLMMTVGAISWEAIRRLGAPEPVAGKTVMVVAAIGIVVNGVTAWMFAGGKDDINLRAAFVHMASDALVAAGVVVAGLAILLTGWIWLDPVVSSSGQRRDRRRDLGPVARLAGHGDGGRAFRHRPRGGARVPSRPGGRRERARSPHLGHEHGRSRAYLPPSHA